jgi:hypothetical protein
MISSKTSKQLVYPRSSPKTCSVTERFDLDGMIASMPEVIRADIMINLQSYYPLVATPVTTHS